MTLYQRIKDYLEKEPRARERKNHKRAIVNVLLKAYPSLKEIPKDTLIEFCADFENGTRAWRDITQMFTHLRGNDYDVDKKVLEQNKLIELDSARLQAIKNI